VPPGAASVGQVAPGLRPPASSSARSASSWTATSASRWPKLSSGSLIGDAVDVIRRHRIQIPPEFAVLARATATLEGVVREVYPAFDVQALILPYVKKLLLRRFDLERAGPEAMSAAPRRAATS
jgi:predicted unusual protein kinase regulating ubiquinone biosynthesis (AarF/ABC1/UbiB family)